MLIQFRPHLLIILASLVTAPLCGCSNTGADQPETGTVSGVVTLDGTPVANAQISFQPAAGRPSSGTTDEEGQYVLIYNATTLGAKVGQHKVSISTIGGLESSVGAKELMPQSVADGSKLTAEVEGGSNEIDFQLESKNFPAATESESEAKTQSE